MTGPKPPAPALAMIQLSMILGPLMFAGVIWFLHTRQGFTPATLPQGIQFGLPVLCILALSGIMIVRRMRAPITDMGQFASFSIIGWAIGESVALAGCVYYFLTNDSTWAVTGILVLLFSAVMLPAKRPD